MHCKTLKSEVRLKTTTVEMTAAQARELSSCAANCCMLEGPQSRTEALLAYLNDFTTQYLCIIYVHVTEVPLAHMFKAILKYGVLRFNSIFHFL